MKSILLEVEHVSISYHNNLVVNDISFTVHSNEILGIVGESGSGKSTLIKAILGILGNGAKIVGGRILFQGKDMKSLTTKELQSMRGSQIGMIFQDCKSALCPIRTIEAQMYEAMSQHTKISKTKASQKARRLLEQLKLQDSERILKSYPFELSGGMNQRVGIMMAMLLEPTLLLADEPTSALDVITQKQVITEMLELKQEFNTAIILVTHNVGVASYMADNILVMQNGRQIEYNKTNELIHNPKNTYTKQLLSAVPKLKRGFEWKQY